MRRSTFLENRSPALFLALALCIGPALLSLPNAAAQQAIGRVLPPASGAGQQQAASFSGVSIANGQTLLTSGSGITAGSAPVSISLARGGTISLCSTSNLHVSASGASASAPLMLALDKGAVEVTMAAMANDAILTPDLRFQIVRPSPALDLRLRISRNGDTCVENRGKAAPVLSVAEQLGDATYQLQPGQHVLFEHGSLKEVVDDETSPCGCPPPSPVSVAASGVTSAHPAAPGAQVGGAVADKGAVPPFPIAVSEGLAPPQQAAPSKPGQVEMPVVSMPLIYSGDAPASSATSASPATAVSTAPSGTGNGAKSASVAHPSAAAAAKPPQVAAPSTSLATAQAPPPADTSPDLAHVIGHFFKRLFRHV
ncbi:MAG: nuclease [Acidobacteriaceae bacterium]